MLPRQLLVPVVTATFLMAVPGLANASWNVNGSGKAAVSAGSLAAPTAVSISACTGSKSAGTVSGTVTLSWSISPTTQTTGQAVYVSGSGTTTYAAANSTIANNTTASVSINYSALAPGTYHVGVAGTRATNWVSAIAGSSNTFAPTTAGSNGGCTRT